MDVSSVCSIIPITDTETIDSITAEFHGESNIGVKIVPEPRCGVPKDYLNLTIVNLSGQKCNVSIDWCSDFFQLLVTSFKLDPNQTFTTKVCLEECLESDFDSSFRSRDYFQVVIRQISSVGPLSREARSTNLLSGDYATRTNSETAVDNNDRSGQSVVWSSHGDWSKIPDTAIATIAKHLTDVIDGVAFFGICHPWRSLRSTLKWRFIPQHPWEVHFQNEAIVRNVLSDGRCKLNPWVIHQRRFYGSPCGWVANISSCLHVNLINILEGETYPLAQGLVNNERPDKFVLFTGCDNFLLVFMIFGQTNRLGFHTSRRWEICNVSNVKDVAYFQGEFFVLCASGALLKCIVSNSSIKFKLLCEGLNVQRKPKIMHLVESSGNLLVVLQYGFTIGKRFATRVFLICKFDFDTNRWVKWNNLGESALFISNGNCTSISATQLQNCKGNSIYFIDNYWEQQDGGVIPPGSYCSGRFDMERKEIICIPIIENVYPDEVCSPFCCLSICGGLPN